ncbi:MAG TPA: hypothetical protein VJ821_00915 [Anaerolineales bacterium]|nr:hypothetical protein [Anaerolineales bacterium]
MNSTEIIPTICGSLFGTLIYVLFFWMFFRAIVKNELVFHGGTIRGSLARIIGVIGIVGIQAGAYLVISLLIFDTEPPGMPVAAFLFGLFCVVMIGVRFLSIFFWHTK